MPAKTSLRTLLPLPRSRRAGRPTDPGPAPSLPLDSYNPVRRRSAAGRRPSGRRAALAIAAALLVTASLSGSGAAAPAPEPAAEASAASLLRSTDLATLVADLRAEAPGIDAGVLQRAVSAATCAVGSGVPVQRPVLTVIDYSLPSTEHRLWVFDLKRRSLIHQDLVAHGVGSGDNFARTFSNTPESLQSSLGLFRTAETYYGKNGYSLRLDGLEEGINDLARPRTIVIHGAPYVSEDFARQNGRLGRSWGCPALPEEAAREVIDTIQGGSLLYVDHREDRDLLASSYLTCSRGTGATAAGAR